MDELLTVLPFDGLVMVTTGGVEVGGGVPVMLSAYLDITHFIRFIVRAFGLKAAFMFALESGIKWRVNKENTLYTGLYLDYGLNSISKKNEGVSFIGYNTAFPQNFSVNSILTSQYMQNGESKDFVSGKVVPIALGIKIRWAFEFDLLR